MLKIYKKRGIEIGLKSKNLYLVYYPTIKFKTKESRIEQVSMAYFKNRTNWLRYNNPYYADRVFDPRHFLYLLNYLESSVL